MNRRGFIAGVLTTLVGACVTGTFRWPKPEEQPAPCGEPPLKATWPEWTPSSKVARVLKEGDIHRLIDDIRSNSGLPDRVITVVSRRRNSITLDTR